MVVLAIPCNDDKSHNRRRSIVAHCSGYQTRMRICLSCGRPHAFSRRAPECLFRMIVASLFPFQCFKPRRDCFLWRSQFALFTYPLPTVPLVHG